MNSQPALPQNRIKILLIEDNPGDIRLIQMMLTQASGFQAEMEAIQRFAPALERLAQSGIDLVLLDLSLPDSFGLDTLVKAQAKAPDVPIVVLTNLDDEERGVEAVQRGAQDYLVKGKVDVSVLGRAIRHAITRKQMEVELNHHRHHLEELVAERTAAEHEQRIFAEALRDSAAAINGTLNLDEVLSKILDLVEKAVPHDAANIMLVENDVARVAGRRGDAERGLEEAVLAMRLPIAETATLARMRANREVLLIPNVEDEPGWFVNEPTRWIRSYVGVPICTGKELIGFLSLNSATSGYFTTVHGKRLQAFVDQAAIAIHNARLYEQVQSHAEKLEMRVAARTAELQAANEHLQALSQVKDEFVSNVSHELRTPITNIRLHHELIARVSDAYAEFMPALQRETDRLSQIIEDLLRLSRLDQGQVKLNIQPIDFNDLASQFVADRTVLAESKDLKLCFNGQPDLPIADGDSGLLGQILSILLTNAMNYTPSGGEITVSTHTQEREGKRWVGFQVSDTGPGITPDDQARLFERFFRGQAGRKTGTPGTGLGLAIVKDIVTRHDGRIEVQSEGIPGRGAHFTIWLPVR